MLVYLYEAGKYNFKLECWSPWFIQNICQRFKGKLCLLEKEYSIITIRRLSFTFIWAV